MYIKIREFYDAYLSSEAVNQKSDQLIDYVNKSFYNSKSSEKLNSQKKAALKSSLLWFAVSTTVIATYSYSKISAPARHTLGGLAMTSLVPPLVSSFHARIHKCTRQLSCKTKLNIVFICFLFSVAHLKISYLMSAKMQLKTIFPLSLLLSNFTINGAIGIVNYLLKNEDSESDASLDAEGESSSPPPEEIERKAGFGDRIEIKEARERVRLLRDKIQKLDQFIISHPELKQLCQEQLFANLNLINLEAVLNLPAPTKAPESLDDIKVAIKYRSALNIEAIDLEYSLNERLELFQRSPELYECFKKYFLEQRHGGQTLFIE